MVAMVYAPVMMANAKGSRDAGQFWRDLSEEVSEFGVDADIAIMGDLNGRIGKLVGDRNVNANGKHILKFCTDHDMVILNEQYAYGEKTFFRLGDGVSTVDYVLVARAAMHRVAGMQVMSNDFGSDHRAVRLWWRSSDNDGSGAQQRAQASVPPPSQCVPRRWRIPRSTSGWTPYVTLAKARMEQWRNQTRKRSGESGSQRVERVWSTFKEAIRSVAQEALGKSSGKPRISGWDREATEWIKEKKRLFREWQAAKRSRPDNDDDRAAVAARASKFNGYRKKVTRWLRAKRRAQEQKQWQKMEAWHEQDPKRFFAKVRQLGGNAKRTEIPEHMQRPDGTHAESGAASEKIWIDHYESIGRQDDEDSAFNEKFRRDISARVSAAAADGGRRRAAVSSEFASSITPKEVNRALDVMKNGKAGGSDGIVVDMLKNGGPTMRRAVHALFTVVWDETHVPEQWLTAHVSPMYKRTGSRSLCASYRPITLAVVVSKVYERVLQDRSMKHLEVHRTIPDEQAAFRAGRSAIDHVFVLSEIIAQRRERQQHTYLAFLDLSSAYDMTWRDGVWWQLLKSGIHGKMWRVMRDMYRSVRNRVNINGKLSDMFNLDRGVRQGSVLSPLLFSLFISGVVKDWEKAGIGVKIAGRRVAGLLFADDIVLVADSVAELHRALEIMDAHARRWRYQFNNSKCAVVAIMNRKLTGQQWQLQGQPIVEQAHYKYLGLCIESGHRWTRWHDARITRAKQRMATLYWCGARNGALAVRTAEKLVRVMLLPVLQYGAEIARPSKAQALESERLQCQAARYILGTQKNTPLDMARGELGWLPVEAQRKTAVMLYFHRLQKMRRGILAREVFAERMIDATSSHTLTKMRTKRGFGLCWAAQSILGQYGLQAHFSANARLKRRKWKALVYKHVQRVEQKQWQERVAARASKDASSSYAFYQGVKRQWRMEKYLTFGSRSHNGGRKWRARMRCGTVPLRARMHRHARASTYDPSCVHCDMHAVDDQAHVMCECPLHAGERAQVFQRIEQQWVDGARVERAWWRLEAKQWSSMSSLERAQWMLRFDSNPSIVNAVNNFLVAIFAERREREQAIIIPSNHAAVAE
jgi:hypothetical protein